MKGLGLDVELLKDVNGEYIPAEEVKIKMEEIRRQDYGTTLETESTKRGQTEE